VVLGMRTIEAEAMCPAIKHLDIVVSDDMWCCIAVDVWHWCSGWGWADGAGSIGAMHGQPIIDVALGNVHSSIGAVIPKLSTVSLWRCSLFLLVKC